MVAVSGGLIFIGYQLMAYGWSQVNGSNAGFFDLLWPGRFTGNSPDSSGGSSAGSKTSTQSPQVKKFIAQSPFPRASSGTPF